MIVFNLLFTPNFATLSNLRLQLVQVTPVVIVALGMAVVVATGGIDLSVGAVMALSAATLAAMIDHGAWIAMGVALIAGILAGLFNGLLVGVVRVQPIVATLGLFIAGRGLALMIADGRLTEIFDPTIRSIGTKQIIGGLQAGVLVAIGLAVIVGVLMRSTIFGKRVVAIGGSPEAARTAGLPVRRSLIFVYVLSGALAAVAGILASARSGASDPSFVGLLDRAERDHRGGRRRHVAGRWGDQGGRHRCGSPADAADLRHLDPPRPVRRGRPDGAGSHHRRRRLHPTGPAPMTADTTREHRTTARSRTSPHRSRRAP